MFMLSLMQPSGLYELEKDSLEAISAQLLQMIQMKSYHLYTHSVQVSNYAVSIAAKMGLPLNEIEQIRHAALLHDVGLLMIPNAMIQKAPYLNKQEMSKYKQHAASGANMKTIHVVNKSYHIFVTIMKNGTVPDIQNIYVAPTFHLGHVSLLLRITMIPL